jgi:CRISPR-associated protein Csd1
MILQALARYYEILAEDPDTDIAPPLYNKVWVSYALNLSLDGDLLDIFPLVTQVKRGDRIEENPVRMIVPEHLSFPI